jgi:hypothetical protein
MKRYGFESLSTEDLAGWVEDVCEVDPSGMSREEMLDRLRAVTQAAGEAAERREENA